ncbi:MAG: CvpA family protein [Acutalibacteraceae bacterium]
MEIILDISVVLVIIIFILLGMKMGFFKTLMRFAGTIICIFLAFYLSSFLSQTIYDNVVKENVVTSISESINKSTDSTLSGGENLYDNVEDTLPGWLRGVLTYLGISDEDKSGEITETFENAKRETSFAVAEKAETLIAPAIKGLLSCVLLIVLFILLKILVSVVVHLLDKVFSLPVLKHINRLLGGVLGLFEGVILAFILVSAIKIILPMLSQVPLIFTSDIINSTMIFKFFYNFSLIDYFLGFVII